MNKAILHLGSNLGDKEKNLEQAIEQLKKHFFIEKRSAFYTTQAWTNNEKDLNTQDNYYNIALAISTDQTALQTLETCLAIELKLGRERPYKWAPRIIDIDLIYHADTIINTPKLTLPHPWMQARKFVLIPLAEIIPHWVHPVLQKNTLELLEECTDEGLVERL